MGFSFNRLITTVKLFPVLILPLISLKQIYYHVVPILADFTNL